MFTAEGEFDVENQRIEIGTDGTVCKEIDTSHLSVQNIFRDMSGLTGYAKRHIMKEQVTTAFYLIIDHRVRDHMIKCTEEEAF